MELSHGTRHNPDIDGSAAPWLILSILLKVHGDRTAFAADALKAISMAG